MIIVGDIGNTETKICLVNSKNIIVKRITLLTKKLSHSLLNKSLLGLGIKDKSINKCLFCSVVPKSFNKIKIFFNPLKKHEQNPHHTLWSLPLYYNAFLPAVSL